MKKLAGAMLLMLLLVQLAGCSKEPTPQDRFSKYIALWNEQKFDQMYDYLSTDAKKKITKEEFTNRYHKIYKDFRLLTSRLTSKNQKKINRRRKNKPTILLTPK